MMCRHEKCEWLTQCSFARVIPRKKGYSASLGGNFHKSIRSSLLRNLKVIQERPKEAVE